MKRIFGLGLLFPALLFWACTKPNEFTSWQTYNGTKAGMKYSSLTQIDTTNVSQLQIAWTYNTGDADTAHASQMQCNPIMVNGTVYGLTPQMRLFAVDALTGKQKWLFDANAQTRHDNDRSSYHIMINGRGVAYWTDGQQDERLFFTAGSNTFAVDAKTGKVIHTFGDNGSIDLHNDLGRDVSQLFVVNSSPGMVFQDLLILGTRVDEAPPAAPGHIRAYDVRTGKLRWIFHTIPHPGEPGYETWEDKNAWQHVGAANVWSGFSLDEKRGILYAPTGSAAYDFYGGKRKGSNLYANCLLALDAASGKLIWHFQFMHHDLWDKDTPTPPALITLQRDGKAVDAVAQTTKNGMVYVFDRVTGKPLFDIQEVPVDTVSELAGEKVWPTQPIPVKPAPFVRQTITEKDINPYLSASEQQELKAKLAGYRKGNMFIPPGTTPAVILPGYDGGGEWGGPAADPETGILYVNANEMAWIMQMRENKIEQATNETLLKAGQRLYKQHCMACHGSERQGLGNNPTLIDIKTKYSQPELVGLLNTGRRMMPAFKHVPDLDKEAIAAFILDNQEAGSKKFTGTVTLDTVNYVPYKMTGYNKFLSSNGYPAMSPPWGTLNAIDLNSGEFVWKITLGEYAELAAQGIPPTGTENYGGPVVTAGGLVFIGASRDGKFRAFNKRNGKLLWEYTLPAAAFATPAVYLLNGKQYVVIACGGGKLNTKPGDAYIAFALP
jgi:quinoprotein glucose dehydrogenase